MLLKERGFAALAVTVLALGIAGVTTMFSVVNAVMIRGFSFPNADRLVAVDFIDPTSVTAFGVNNQVSALDYQELRATGQAFERLAAYLSGSTVNVTVDGRPERYTGAYVADEFFRILGVAPIRGRDFNEADNRPGAPKVAILSYGVWQRDFGGAEDAINRLVRVNGAPATIVGVMPPGFAFPQNEELWVPLFSEYPPKARNDPSGFGVAVLALIRPDVSLDQATAQTTSLAARLAADYPETNKRFATGRVRWLIDAFTPLQIRGTLLTMLGFSAGVLLLACANVMNMQFARATLRTRELAVRSSLGAGRGRLIRQMLTESLLLAAIGAVAGVALAYGATHWLQVTIRSFDSPPPAYIVFDVDAVVLAVTVVAAVLAAVLSGLLPALRSSRLNAVEVLRDATRGTTSGRLGLVSRSLVVFQIGVTGVLLVGAMLQLRSIANQTNIDFGYDTAGLVSARMGLMEGAYPSPEARKQFFDRLVERLARNAEYESVALTNRFRMVFSGSAPVEIDGRTYQQDRDRPLTNFEQVTPGFFDVTAQRIMDGRGFTEQDLESREPVAIVNAAFAAKHFAGQAVLNRRFRTTQPNGAQPSPWFTIVGVVSTVRMQGPFNAPGADEAGFYVPFYTQPVGSAPPGPAASQFATVVVKPRGGRVDAAMQTVRRDVAAVDPNLPLYYVGTPKTQIDAFVSQNRVIATLFTIFGVVAMLLAAVGIYGVMSFVVNQRRQELGVRMVLGADRKGILMMVLRQSAVQVVMGTAAGLGLALGLARVAGAGIQTVLFDTSATDPATYVTVAAIILAASFVATIVPARRATKVEPMVALRSV